MFSLIRKIANKAKDMVSTANAKIMVATGAALIGASVSAQEAGTVTLPTTGVDVAGYASAGITQLGTIVAVCIGGVVAFMIVKWGVKWVRGIGK